MSCRPTRPAPTCAAGWGEPPRPVSRTNGLLTWPLSNRNPVSSINAYGNWTKKIPFPMSNSAHTERLSRKCGVCHRFPREMMMKYLLLMYSDETVRAEGERQP